MALSGSAWKHVSSSGVSTRLGARPARAPESAAACASRRASRPAESRRAGPRVLRVRDRGVVRHCRSASGLCASLTSGGAPNGPRGPRVTSPLRAATLLPRGVRRLRLGSPATASRSAARPSLLTRHRMRQDYPLNLSISLSGGEETNQDAPSNGE